MVNWKEQINHFKASIYSSLGLSAIIFVLLLVLLFCFVSEGFTINPFVEAKNAAPVKKSLNYITKTFFPDGVTLTEAKRENGIFHFKFKDKDGKEYDGFVTKNGKMLFPSYYDLSAFSETKKTASTETKTETKSKIEPSAQPEVKLFTMAFCPFGNQAEANIIPVVNLLKGKIEIEPHYVIYENYPQNDKSQFKNYCWDETGKYCSMHGKSELYEDVRELCVYKYQKDKYWDFVARIDKNCTVDNVDTCWQSQAASLSLDKNQIENCFKSEGEKMLAEEKSLNEKYGVMGSPDLRINQVTYEGNRTPEAYKEAICSAFLEANKPSVCQQKLPDTDQTNQTNGGSCS